MIVSGWAVEAAIHVGHEELHGIDAVIPRNETEIRVGTFGDDLPVVRKHRPPVVVGIVLAAERVDNVRSEHHEVALVDDAVRAQVELDHVDVPEVDTLGDFARETESYWLSAQHLLQRVRGTGRRRPTDRRNLGHEVGAIRAACAATHESERTGRRDNLDLTRLLRAISKARNGNCARLGVADERERSPRTDLSRSKPDPAAGNADDHVPVQRRSHEPGIEIGDQVGRRGVIRDIDLIEREQSTLCTGGNREVHHVGGHRVGHRFSGGYRLRNGAVGTRR